MKDIEKSIEYPLASRDSEGRLIVGGAVGVSKDLQQRAKLLVDAGVDVFVLDSAHGDSKGVVEAVKLLKDFQRLMLLLGMLPLELELRT